MAAALPTSPVMAATLPTSPVIAAALPTSPATPAPGMNIVPMVPAALPMNLAGSLLKLVATPFHSAPVSCALPFGSAIQLVGWARFTILPNVAAASIPDLRRAMFAPGLAAHSSGLFREATPSASCTIPLPAS
jgi:hypothetical protein